MLSLRRAGVPRWARLPAGILAAALALLAAGAGPARADSVRSAQAWVLNAISASAAWAATQGQGVTVAVIDSGVNPQVSDLAGSVTTGPDFTGVSTPQSSPGWGVHGTWMASLIAGHGHGSGGSSGILGIAPQARVLSLRVITDSQDPGNSSYQHEQPAQVQSGLADAISYAVSHGAGVISMSVGYGTPSLTVRSALQDALNHGVVVVASSGNSGDDTSAGGPGQAQAPYSFPADYPGVLGVAALQRGGRPAAFSSDNLSVQVAAPGVDVPAQGRDGQYWLVSGTSPACALTAGVAALIRSADPGLPPDLVRRAITTTTTDRPAGGYDEQVGFGTVNAAAALAAAGQLAASGFTGPGMARSSHAASTATTTGTAPASHFGGGPAAAAPPPLAPRGPWRLVAFSVLAVACLAVVAATMSRLAAAWGAVIRPAAGCGPAGTGGESGAQAGSLARPGLAPLRYPWSAPPPGRHVLPPDKHAGGLEEGLPAEDTQALAPQDPQSPGKDPHPAQTAAPGHPAPQ